MTTYIVSVAAVPQPDGTVLEVLRKIEAHDCSVNTDGTLVFYSKPEAGGGRLPIIATFHEYAYCVTKDVAAGGVMVAKEMPKGRR